MNQPPGYRTIFRTTLIGNLPKFRLCTCKMLHVGLDDAQMHISWWLT